MLIVCGLGAAVSTSAKTVAKSRYLGHPLTYVGRFDRSVIIFDRLGETANRPFSIETFFSMQNRNRLITRLP